MNTFVQPVAKQRNFEWSTDVQSISENGIIAVTKAVISAKMMQSDILVI
jgi:hypothetical protein